MDMTLAVKGDIKFKSFFPLNAKNGKNKTISPITCTRLLLTI